MVERGRECELAVMWCCVLSIPGSSALHRSPQAEGVPAPHHLPEEPAQVCADRRRGQEDLHAEVHQGRWQGPH